MKNVQYIIYKHIRKSFRNQLTHWFIDLDLPSRQKPVELSNLFISRIMINMNN